MIYVWDGRHIIRWYREIIVNFHCGSNFIEFATNLAIDHGWWLRMQENGKVLVEHMDHLVFITSLSLSQPSIALKNIYFSLHEKKKKKRFIKLKLCHFVFMWQLMDTSMTNWQRVEIQTIYNIGW